MSDEAKRFSIWVRRKIRDQGITQRDVARKAGLSEYTIHLAVHAKHDPQISTVMKIADALGYSLVFRPKKGR